MDKYSEQRLAPTLIIPELAAIIRTMYARLMTQQIEIRVVQGLRTFADQQKLYMQSRTVPPTGPRVTDAPGGYSMHNFGLAVDCMPDKVWGVPWTPDDDAKDDHYRNMVNAGEVLGLNCGALWHSFVDTPHFQLRGVPDTPTDAMRADLASGGLPLIWSNTLAGKYTEV